MYSINSFYLLAKVGIYMHCIYLSENLVVYYIQIKMHRKLKLLALFESLHIYVSDQCFWDSKLFDVFR